MRQSCLVTANNGYAKWFVPVAESWELGTRVRRWQRLEDQGRWPVIVGCWAVQRRWALHSPDVGVLAPNPPIVHTLSTSPDVRP